MEGGGGMGDRAGGGGTGQGGRSWAGTGRFGWGRDSITPHIPLPHPHIPHPFPAPAPLPDCCTQGMLHHSQYTSCGHAGGLSYL